jgi:glyoxylate/hydroxypyruvate reductase
MTFVLKAPSDNVDEWRRELVAHVPDLDIRTWPDVGNPEEVELAFMVRPPPGELKRYPNLKAFFNLNVGVDTLLFDPDLPRHIPVARTVDPGLVRMITTYLLYSVIRYHRSFDEFALNQSCGHWEYLRARANHECRVGIMGLGVLGSDAATTLRDLGFAVAGWSRTPRALDGIEAFHGRDGFGPFLSRTDILCCVLPLTADTHQIINRGSLAWLPRGARLINIARGPVMVDSDVLDALDSGQLGGATLDVFDEEPLPSDSPFWRHPRVVVTPHVAGNTTPATAAPQVAENIRRARQGLPLINQIDFGRGY